MYTIDTPLLTPCTRPKSGLAGVCTLGGAGFKTVGASATARCGSHRGGCERSRVGANEWCDEVIIYIIGWESRGQEMWVGLGGWMVGRLGGRVGDPMVDRCLDSTLRPCPRAGVVAPPAGWVLAGGWKLAVGLRVCRWVAVLFDILPPFRGGRRSRRVAGRFVVGRRRAWVSVGFRWLYISA